MQNAWETQQHRKKAAPWDQKERRQKAIELVTPAPGTVAGAGSEALKGVARQTWEENGEGGFQAVEEEDC